MTRQDLEEGEHAALVELALRLQARVAALEAEHGRANPMPPPAKTPENSSLPPAKGFKRSLRPPPSGGKRGPKPGHLGMSRQRVEPDHVLVCRPTACRACGADLADVPQGPVGRHQITELPVLHAVVLEAQRYQATCAGCGTRTTAAAPPGFTRGRVFGPRLAAALSYLHQQSTSATRACRR
jgi:transposase